MKKWATVFVCMLFISQIFAQDSVDVTFRYNISGTPTGLTVPGQFNGWNNGAWPMIFRGGTLWTRDARLAVGGAPSPIPGAFQYKFYYQGASPWPNDPLNHHVNTSDNDNTFIIVKNPTIYHLLPNHRSGTVTTTQPTISAYIFPKVGTTFDTSGLALTIDGATITGIGSTYDFSVKQMSYTVPAPLANGSHTVILQAGTTLDTVNFILQVGGPTLAPLPSYAKHGVTLPSAASSDSTTFRLRVGGTTFVALRVAPAGQPVAGASPVLLRKNPTTDDWWINMSLPAGTYEYQFQTASGSLFNDPWGKWNGTYGTRFTIGPAGLTADDYVWRSTNYQRKPLNKIVLYETNIAEFVGGYLGLPSGQIGTFLQMSNMMGYFDSLGINAIELMPINDYGLIGRSGFSWGYDLSHHFALEPAYGTPRDFKVLVDSAHARGIAIVLDVVFNHVNDPGPLWSMQPDVAANPYIKLCTDLRYNEDQLCFFRDMDHWTGETQEYIYNVLKMWIDEYRVDGFRYDYTQGIGWNVNEPTKGILGWANRIDQDYQGRVYQIAEHLPESPALLYNSGITSGWHDSFRDEVFKDVIPSQRPPLVNFQNLVIDLGAYGGNDIPSTPSSYADRTGPVNANVNHDEQSLIFEMTTWQGVSLADAIKRDKMYATFIFASLGIPMLWEGMENSESRGWATDGDKLRYRPVQFSLRNEQRGQEHYAWYKALIRQRKYNPALNNGALIRLSRFDAQKTLFWGFQDVATNARFVAVTNLTNTDQTFNGVQWIGNGTFYNILDQSTITASGGFVSTITVPAWSALCYSSIPDSTLDVKPTNNEIPTEFGLSQNYPNPFNPTTTIRFSIKNLQFTILKVYDLLGREVTTVVNSELPAGHYTADFSGKGLSSGVYFYRLTSGSFSEMKKMVLTK